MNTFLHSGDMGDIIYSLPAVKAAGGGWMYLDTSGGAHDELVVSQAYAKKRLKFNNESYAFIKPILEEQSYIEGVSVWSGEDVQYNLNLARVGIGHEARMQAKHNLAWRYFKLMREYYEESGIKESYDPWLEVSNVIDKNALVVSRNLRYQQNHPFWEVCVADNKDRMTFIGTDLEYQVFSEIFYPVKRALVGDALEYSREIAGGGLFIGNQTLGSALAIGIGKPYIMEVVRYANNCIFKRENGQYV